MDLLFTIILIAISALMIVLVLLHKGRGGGLSDMFGGGVSSSLGGSSVAERNLDRLTVGIGVIWFACVIALGLLLPTRADEREPSVAGGGNAIRGSRVGAGPMGEAERGEAAPRQAVTYFCSHEHRSVVDLLHRGRRAGLLGLPASAASRPADSENPPPAPKIEPYKTHLAYVKERRSDAEAADILDEALAAPPLAPQVRRHHLLTPTRPDFVSRNYVTRRRFCRGPRRRNRRQRVSHLATSGTLTACGRCSSIGASRYGRSA